MGHASIRRLSIVVDDFEDIYYDFGSFGIHVGPPEKIKTILEDLQTGTIRRVELGDKPIIAYFTGHSPIVSARAPFGRVAATHRASHGMGGPRGVSINNMVQTDLEFLPPKTFDRAIDSLMPVLRFLEVIAGRRQNLLLIELELDLPKDRPDLGYFEVYWSAPPSRSTATRTRRPHPGDLPLNGGMQPEEFGNVMGRWLTVDHERRDARQQFSEGFSNGERYSAERLVSSANMFDILPANAAPKNVDLSQELQAASAAATKLFKALSSTIERDSILNALGRLGTANLKRKVQYRAKRLLDAVPERFPDLILVLDEAINCRNHYVHGASAKINYRSHFPDTVIFFIDTLEFVFAASDLIDAGWDIKPWLERPTSMTHPFGSFRVSYADRLQTLKALLKGKRDRRSS